MDSSETTPKPRVPSRETLATRAFATVQRARKDLADAKAAERKATDRHAKRICDKRAVLTAAEKALDEFLPQKEPTAADARPQD